MISDEPCPLWASIHPSVDELITCVVGVPEQVVEPEYAFFVNVVTPPSVVAVNMYESVL